LRDCTESSEEIFHVKTVCRIYKIITHWLGLFFKSKHGQYIVNEGTGLCLDATGLRASEYLKTSKCDSNIKGQIWKFDPANFS
jgi:hypothetical protein